MSYTPNNEYVYLQAFSGAVAGLLGQSTSLTTGRGTYTKTISIAGAWAQAVDTQWGDSTNPDQFENAEILAFSTDLFAAYDPQPRSVSANPATYTATVAGMFQVLSDAETYLADQGISPQPITSQSTYNVVLRPGGTAGGNVYTSSAALFAASVSQGWQGQVLVTVDDSIESPVHLTAESVNIGPELNWLFTGVANYNDARGTAAMVIDDGFHFVCTSSVQMSITNVDITSPATTNTSEVPEGIEFNLTLDGTSIVYSESDVYFASVSQIGGGGFLEVFMRDFSVVGDGTHGVFSIGAGFGTIDEFNGSHVFPNSIALGGTISYDASSEIIATDFGVGFTLIRRDNAAFTQPAADVSANRPTGNAVIEGQMFFDESVPSPQGGPLWWNGSVWIGPSLLGTAIGTAPTTTATGALGSTGTLVITAGGNDTCGQITLTPGGAGIATGVQGAINFTAHLPASPRSVILTPANTNAAAIMAAAAGGVYVAGFNDIAWNVGTNTALTTGVPYIFNYVVLT
jgi:hypothetical protein